MSLVTLCTPKLVSQLSWMEIWSIWLAHVYCLSGTNLKNQLPPPPLFSITLKNVFLLFFPHVHISPFPQIIILAILKSPNQNHLWYPHCSTTIIPGSTANDNREIQLKSIVHNPFSNTLKIEFKCPCYTLQEHQLQIAFMKVNVIYLFYFTDWGLWLCPRNCTNMESSINLKSEHCPILYHQIV